DFRGLVETAGDDAGAVRAVCHTRYLARVPLVFQQLRAGSGVPHPRLSARVRLCKVPPAADEDPCPVRAERQRLHVARVPLELEQARAGHGVPHLHLPVPTPRDDPRTVLAQRHDRAGPVDGVDSTRALTPQIVPFPAAIFGVDTVQTPARLRYVAVVECGDG